VCCKTLLQKDYELSAPLPTLSEPDQEQGRKLNQPGLGC
jgi:hypothetical protein